MSTTYVYDPVLNFSEYQLLVYVDLLCPEGLMSSDFYIAVMDIVKGKFQRD